MNGQFCIERVGRFVFEEHDFLRRWEGQREYKKVLTPVSTDMLGRIFNGFRNRSIRAKAYQADEEEKKIKDPRRIYYGKTQDCYEVLAPLSRWLYIRVDGNKRTLLCLWQDERGQSNVTPEVKKALEWKDYLGLFFVSDDEAETLWPSICRSEQTELLYENYVLEEEYHASKTSLLQRLTVQGAKIDPKDVVIAGPKHKDPNNDCSVSDLQDSGSKNKLKQQKKDNSVGMSHENPFWNCELKEKENEKPTILMTESVVNEDLEKKVKKSPFSGFIEWKKSNASEKGWTVSYEEFQTTMKVGTEWTKASLVPLLSRLLHMRKLPMPPFVLTSTGLWLEMDSHVRKPVVEMVVVEAVVVGCDFLGPLVDPTLQVPLDEIQVDAKLNFVEILEREFKKLKRSKIAIVKVQWNSKHGPEFTWEHEDQMKLKYPHLFSDVSS
ncbi:hypothetical protein Tco_0802050 [Tanacetum coccineum]|uniref:Reverse transcriptase domain-containing protein n=1 Tax=Tanacetum coccineum TaxID=301880 RepID=A0ABQ5A1X2_9ASTR